MPLALNVWMNGELVGVWYHTRQRVPAFRYAGSWIDSPSRRALSLSLPITAGNGEHRGDVVANYFENLLPDNANIRKRLGSRFQTKSTRAFDLLMAIGRDCVGAVQLLPEDMQPQGWNRIDSEALSDDQVEQILRATTSEVSLGQRQGNDEDFRISIAGAQEKTALLRFGGGWRRPLDATPTTHILKLPLGLVGNMRADMSDSVENEWLCAQITRELGLGVARTEMADFGNQKVLVVERFDRRWQGIPDAAQNAAGFTPTAATWIARIPQEDMCQATGTAPTLKYETDGGPSIAACLELLAGSERAEDDRARFILAQFAFWLLAATDGHAKNFSIHHGRGGGFGLTPLYDVVSAWPIIGEGPNMVSRHDARLAMALRSKNAHYKLGEIHARHWRTLAQRCGAPGVWERLHRMANGVDAALERLQGLLPDAFPSRVWDAVHAGTKRHANQFLSESKLLF